MFSLQSIKTTWKLLFVILLSSMPKTNCSKKYEPNWKSLDSRPLPSWYDEAKVGIFVVWGVYSVPSFASLSSEPAEWFWYRWKHDKRPDVVDFMKKNYSPRFTYADFAPKFTAELFDPTAWAKIFKSSGAKYIVLTAKHHDGFNNYPSKYSFNWNSVDVGPKRDLVGDLAKAIRSHTNITFGLYHSLFEWFNPLYLQDKKNNFQTNSFVVDKTYPELIEIVNRYKPEIIWSDGDWGPVWYWNSTVFLSWLYNESPVKDTVVVNDRWGTLPDGSHTSGKHGDFWDGTDRYKPGHLLKHKWENAFTIDKRSWGLNRNTHLKGYLTIKEILFQLVQTVAYGGNVLINVGPTADGRILPIFEERLGQLGSWLKVNGEAIYGTSPKNSPCSKIQKDTITPTVYYTCKPHFNTFAIFLEWPEDNQLLLGSVKHCPSLQAEVVGLGKVSCKANKKGSVFDLNSVVSKLVSKGLHWAWVLKFKLE
jgi:alpha-L-fucosidase